MPRPFVQALVLGAALLAGERPVRAEPASAEATALARQRYEEGARAYAENRYKDAVDLFLAANRVAPNPAFAYNVGLAYEDLGDADNALLWYRSYLRDLPNAADRAEIEPRIAAAESRLRARGVQQITVLSTPAAATVSIDGERLGVTPWTGQLKPGRHRVELELRGYEDATEMVDLPSDHAIDFPVALRPVALPAKTAAALPPSAREEPPSGPDEPSSSRGRIGVLTWAALGVGAAGLGTAVVFELSRSSSVDDARRAGTNLEGKDLYDQAKSEEAIARVALGVGSAFAIAGGVLLYLDLSSGQNAVSQARAALGCAGPTCGVAVHGQF